MEFKCKNCNSTKYRQISISVKQCEECGMQTQSEGSIDPKILDVTEEPDTTKKKGKEINPESSFNPFRVPKVHRIVDNDGAMHFYIDPEDWFRP